MMVKKTTTPTVEAVSVAMNQAKLTIFQVEDTTPASIRQDSLLTASLPVGEHNAVHASELAARLGLRTHRALRAHIAAARRRGVLVCSSSAGYFLPESAAEAAACSARLTKSARSVLACVRPLRRVPLDGQTVITEQEVVPAKESEAQCGEKG